MSHTLCASHNVIYTNHYISDRNNISQAKPLLLMRTADVESEKSGSAVEAAVTADIFAFLAHNIGAKWTGKGQPVTDK
jgi:hypothetical protein